MQRAGLTRPGVEVPGPTFRLLTGISPRIGRRLQTTTRQASQPMWRPGLQTRLAEHRIFPLGGSVMTLTVAQLWTWVAIACLIAAQPAPASAQEPGEASTRSAARCATTRTCRGRPGARPAADVAGSDRSLQAERCCRRPRGCRLPEAGDRGAPAGKDSALAPLPRVVRASAPAFTAVDRGRPARARARRSNAPAEAGPSPADLSWLKVRGPSFPSIDSGLWRPGRRRRPGSWAAPWRVCAGPGRGKHPWRCTAGASMARRRALADEGWPTSSSSAIKVRGSTRSTWRAASALANRGGRPDRRVITGAPKLHDGRLYVPISVVRTY